MRTGSLIFIEIQFCAGVDHKMKKDLKNNLIIYFSAVLAVIAVKVYYRTADSEMLSWILAPTTRWVQVLSGISFEKMAYVGYVSHEYQFIIAPSCSGVRFLLTAFVMMVISFTHQMDSRGKKIVWLGASAFFSYVSTIFVNGIRITVSIYLPMMLGNDVLTEWLTAQRLHTMIGTVIYFSMLLGIYCLVQCIWSHAAMREGTGARRITKCLVTPVFWYFAMVLGVPFLGRLYRNDWDGFWQYALFVTGICTLVVLMFGLLGTVVRRFGNAGAAFVCGKKT